MSEGRPKPFWRWFWPKVDDLEGAKTATQYGFVGAVFISVLTAGVVTVFSLVWQKPIPGVSGMGYLEALIVGYLDALIMAIVAWRVRHFSRAFALGGIAIYIAGKFFLVLTSSEGFGGMWIWATIFLIHGARGAFAYNRFKPTSIWGEFSHAGEPTQPFITVAMAIAAENNINKGKMPPQTSLASDAPTSNHPKRLKILVIGVVVLCLIAVATFLQTRPSALIMNQENCSLDQTPVKIVKGHVVAFGGVIGSLDKLDSTHVMLTFRNGSSLVLDLWKDTSGDLATNDLLGPQLRCIK